MILKGFGKTGRMATPVGLGGEGVLRTFGRRAEALAVINEAVLQGINYFDSARAYDGSEGYYGAFWAENGALRSNLFQASKSASRDYAGAMADLKATLDTTGLDHLDLWQIHDVRTMSDVMQIEGAGGALDAFIEAKECGLVRAMGVTGHHDPRVLSRAVSSWPVDSVLLPINPVEGIIGGFIDTVLHAARDMGIATIGMKVLGGSHYLNPGAGVTPQLLLKYALSQDISIATVGCSSPLEVRELARAARDFKPMEQQDQASLLEIFRPYARRLAFYRGVI